MKMNKRIVELSLPLLLSLVAQNVINVTDTAFLGRLGEIELGASAIGGMAYVIFYMLGFGFCMGTQAQIGKRNGEGNHREIGSIFTHGMLMLILLGVLFTIAAELVFPPLLRMSMQSEQVADASVRFLSVRMLGLVFVYAVTQLRTLYIGLLRTKILIVNALFMAVVNIVLDYCLIFGHWGFPAMGVEGAALASVLAEASSLLFLFLWTYCRLDWRRYDLTFKRRYTWQGVSSILGLSSYTMLQYFLSLSTYLIFFIAVERIGERPLAISNVLRSLYLLLVMPSQALGTTAGTMISNAIGRGEQHRVIPILNRNILFGFIFAFLFLLLTLFVPEWLIRVYTDSPDLIREGASSLWVIGLSILLFSGGVVSINGMFGAAKGRLSFLVEMLAMASYAAFVYVFIWRLQSSLSICWMGEWVYWGVTFVASYSMLHYFNRKRLF